MGYSVNFYLNNAISKKNVDNINSSNDREGKKEIQKRINELPLQIFIYLRFSGRTVKAFMERKCTQKEWNIQKQRVNPRYYKSGATTLNNYLERIHNEICTVYEDNLKNNTSTTKEHIKEIIYKANEKDNKGYVIPTFEEAFNEFTNVSKLKKQNSTITIYKTLFKHLRNFSKVKRVPLIFDRITLKFEDQLRAYLINDLMMTNNTIAKYIKTLKTFLNYATERGYNRLIDYKKFDSKEREKEVYALTLDELMKLYNYDFPEEKFNNVRDVFCFACFTGLRYSDVANLKRVEIKENGLHLSIKKTKENIVLPLSPFAQKILANYEDNEKPLPVISSQKTNNYLKEIGELLEFDEPVRILLYRGQEKIEEYVPKYKVLTFHIARKTFITNSLILGMNERVVKEFSGHKKEENFRKYVKYADNYKEKVMNSVWNEEQIAKIQQS